MRSLLFVACLAGPIGALPAANPLAPASMQSSQEKSPESQAQRWVQLAREGAPHIRPQAAQRLAGMGEVGLTALLAAAGDDLEGLGALGADLVEVLGDFGDAGLRARAWEALGDPDFPWRPSAARSLAKGAAADELPRFVELLDDPLSAVRVAALGAFPEQPPAATLQRIAGLLEDEDGRVRRAAAFELDARGVRWARLWLIEELGRVDRWFEVESGRLARFDAARLLRRAGVDLGPYEPARDPREPEMAAAIVALRSAAEESLDREPPGHPPAYTEMERGASGLLGLELRSCRRGELFLQWGPGDALFVGRGIPRRIELAPGTAERLEASAREALAGLAGQTVFGRPGCDLEAFRVALDGQPLSTLYLQKGPEPVPDLRLPALDALALELIASLPDGEAALAARLRATLEAVGGPLTDDR